MFLSCCCRGQKEGKKRRRGGGGAAGGTDRVSPDPGYQPSISFSPHSPIFTIQSQRPAPAQSSSLSSEEFFYYQDVYLHSKETLPRPGPAPRPRVSFTGVDTGGGGGGAQLTFIDTEAQAPRTLPRTASVRGPADPAGHRVPPKIFASPENFKLSVRSLSQSSRSVISSSPELMRNHFKQLSTFRYRLHTELSASSHCSSDSRGSSSTSTDHAPDPPTSFQSGLKRSTAFHTAELLQQQLLVDEAEELLEEDEELSKSESLHDSSQSSRVSASSLAQPPLAPRSLKKSTAFHDRTTLEQQIVDSEARQLQVRKKLLEEYVQHVLAIKMDHQAQLDKVEEIYKTNLDELADIVDGDVEAAVRSVRRKADKALESLKTTDGNGNNKGNCGPRSVSVLTDFLVGRKESFPHRENTEQFPQQPEEEIRVSMTGKLHKLQLYIDNKAGDLRKLSDQLRLVQLELEQAERERENVKQIISDLA